MNSGHVFALATRIVQQLRRDHRTLALLFFAPPLILGLLGYLLRSQESGALVLGISNQDQPVAPLNVSLAGRLVDQLRNSGAVTVQVVPGPPSAARAAVRDGSVDAALVFSPTFSADLLAHRPVSLDLILEGSNPTTTGSALPAIQGALLQASAAAQAALPGATAPPVLRVQPDLIYGSTSLKPLDYLAPALIGFFAFFLIFLLTCISFLRERTQGTMERLAASPITRGEIVVGYMLGFGLFALIQSAIVVLFTAYVLQVHYAGNLFWIFAVTLMLALSAVNLGIFLSTYARTELQAVQFIPLVIVPQGLLAGLLWPVHSLPGWLQVVAGVMPMTYATEALTNIMVRGFGVVEILPQLGVLALFAVALVALAGLTLRREIA